LFLAGAIQVPELLPRSNTPRKTPNRAEDPIVGRKRVLYFRIGAESGKGMPSPRLLFVDLLLIALATVAAAIVRDNFAIVAPRLIALLPYLVVMLGVAALVFPMFGVSRPLWRFTSMRDGLRIVAATLGIVLGAVAIGFGVNRLEGVARSLPMIQGLLIISFLVGGRVLIRLSHDRRVRSAPACHSDRLETVLVIGLNKLAELYMQCLAELDTGRVRIAGLLGEGARVGLLVHSHPVLGTPEQVASTLRRLELHGVFVDRILVAAPRGDLSVPARDALSQIQETTTIDVEYLVERMGIQSSPAGSAAPESKSKETVSSTVVAIDHAFEQLPYQKVKRVADLVGAAVLLVALTPLFLIVSILVAMDVGLPLVFWQQRPGVQGRPFKLYKFRTMADGYGSEAQRKSDNARVSAIGDFLRGSRLDELPQLLNILKGEMSFVGPRPLLPVDQPSDSRFRLLMRPGLTGWAQIKGGRQVSPADKAALDVWYVRNVSLTLDLKIILGTVPMLIFGERVTEAAIIHARREIELADSVTGHMMPEIS
jgi:lipopolysaccharide/colanic/teichoic acid biosynthesis glycosyltransferase